MRCSNGLRAFFISASAAGSGVLVSTHVLPKSNIDRKQTLHGTFCSRKPTLTHHLCAATRLCLQIQGQRVEVAKLDAERAALSRLDKIRLDQGARATALEREAAASEERASLIEYNLEAVDAAIDAVNAGGWSQDSFWGWVGGWVVRGLTHQPLRALFAKTGGQVGHSWVTDLRKRGCRAGEVNVEQRLLRELAVYMGVLVLGQSVRRLQGQWEGAGYMTQQTSFLK